MPAHLDGFILERNPIVPSLTILFGDQAGKHFVLANRPVSIGRDPTRDIQLVDPKVSRKHAMIRREGDCHIIVAVKALNGIQINGKAIEAESMLSSGDEIVLGDTILQYSDSTGAGKDNAMFDRKSGGRESRDQHTIM
jgi:pSer/pThr/pTyr-binding forkhead associated (FHA) protein